MQVDEDGVIVTPFLRTAFNYDSDLASRQSGLACLDPSRTQQEFREECDINTIVERFGLGGEIPLNSRMPFQDEFVDITDYRTALDKIREADEAFMEFPAEIRARFENDPAKFCDYVSDPKNLDQAREWGLARALEPAREPIEVKVIPTPLEAPKSP